MSRTLRPCIEPGCPELVDRGPCLDHRRERERSRGSRRKRGYGPEHERWAAAVLRRDRNCVRCAEAGRQVRATVADHIEPWQQGGAKLDIANGRGLCATCHNQVRQEQGI